ncbi:hypothetical protein SAMN05443549_102425 [Flavobacterium fluvii]|uniref:Uncharacterized protein n=1 Tax=Flavobacterium fluvii TaxID=468056 RepID=A0A1M5HXL0_9FLAO|nr:hypothetical protein SAMN05443549_102425 [Flavobacterium fluvii]
MFRVFAFLQTNPTIFHNFMPKTEITAHEMDYQRTPQD